MNFRREVELLAMTVLRCVVLLVAVALTVVAIVVIIRDKSSVDSDRYFWAAVCLYGVEWGLGKLQERM